MRMMDIIDFNPGEVPAPNANWNVLLNQLRDDFPADAARQLGHYSASIVLERHDNSRDIPAVRLALMDAAQPPFDYEERTDFLNAFAKQELVQLASDRAQAAARGARA
jgi:hypothetical protein